MCLSVVVRTLIHHLMYMFLRVTCWNDGARMCHYCCVMHSILQHVSECLSLTEEFRHLSDRHANHEDKLQVCIL